MRSATSARRVGLVLLGALVVLGLAVGSAYSAAAKPDYGLGVNPASQSVQQGQTTTYTVTVTGVNGFAGAVALSVSGLPTGATGSFSPASLALSSTTTTATSTLTVVTATTTPVGSSSLTITGTNGNTKRTVSATLTVNYALNGSFSLTAAPSSVSVAPGSTAVYTITVTGSNGLAGSVAMAAYGSWPAGTSASFNPASVSLASSATTATSTLQVSTSQASTPDGTYTLAVVGSYKSPTSGATTYQYAQTQLVVDSKLSAKSFSISGGTPAKLLAPGVADQPLNLALTNPNNQALPITNLSVVVTGTSAGASCSPTNFQVTQYSGAYPLNLPAKSTNATLASLGIPAAQQPQLKMLDLPKNQDACKGVTIYLSFSGSASGS